MDAAVRENGKPLADLTLDEAEDLYACVVFYLVLLSATSTHKAVVRA